MTASNLGMIFSTVVFGEEEGTTLETLSHFKVHTLYLFEAMIARTDNNLIIGLDYGAAHQAAINSLGWLTYRTTSPRSVEKSERKPQQLRPTTFSSICAIHTIPAVSSIWRAQSVSEYVCVECSKPRLDRFLLDRLPRAILTISDLQQQGIADSPTSRSTPFIRTQLQQACSSQSLINLNYLLIPRVAPQLSQSIRMLHDLMYNTPLLLFARHLLPRNLRTSKIFLLLPTLSVHLDTTSTLRVHHSQLLSDDIYLSRARPHRCEVLFQTSICQLVVIVLSLYLAMLSLVLFSSRLEDNGSG